MAGYIYSAADYVKQLFSATESYLLQLKGAGGAVIKVLKPNIRKKEFLRQAQTKDDIDVTYNDNESLLKTEDGFLNEASNSIQKKYSVLSCILGSVCYPFFPCAQLICPSKCTSTTSGTSSNSCTSCGCNCCLCFGSGNCLCNIVKSQAFFNIIAVLSPFLVLFYLFWTYYDEYVSKILTSFEEMNQELAFVLFVILFIFASLPLVWGYVVLNLAAGYRFGIVTGVFVVMISVTIGLSLTHRISQRFCSGCILKLIKRQTNSDHIEGILKVLDSSAGLKVIALTRLTPIPFGLQNGIFSMSNIKTRHYVAASNIGLLPTQVLNCYIGSTFRSAEDVFNRGGSVGGYFIFFIQLSIGVALMTFVIRHARKELASALQDSNNKADEKGRAVSDSEMLSEVRITQPISGTT